MSKTKAMVVGVSNYFHNDANDLLFCKNDIAAIEKAFMQGLNVMPKDIITLGEQGTVFGSDFVDSIKDFTSRANAEDVLLFYFSGHGTNFNGEHYIVLSDKFVKTQQIIECLNLSPSRSKVLFFDCCQAGNFVINGPSLIDIEVTADEFVGKGNAIFASSNASQFSYKHPDKLISLFTSFLCEALTAKFICKKGKKSLDDIHKLLFLMVEMWNKKHPEHEQTPIYRASINGTINFDVTSYIPYFKGEFYVETETYVIHSIEPLHNNHAKRFAVKVILKSPMSFSEIAEVNLEIVNRVKYINIFSGPKYEKMWKGSPANLVFCYFGFDETDITNGNYVCNTTWADETQDRNHWYRTGKNYETIGNINFNINPYYTFTKQQINEHTPSKKTRISETKSILHKMIFMAEEAIYLYNEYLNNEKTETELIDSIKSIAPKVEELYLQESTLEFPPSEIADWCNLCSSISASIHNLIIYYSAQHFLMRSPENRKACMEMAIKQYYTDLEQLKETEKGLPAL